MVSAIVMPDGHTGAAGYLALIQRITETQIAEAAGGLGKMGKERPSCEIRRTGRLSVGPSTAKLETLSNGTDSTSLSSPRTLHL